MSALASPLRLLVGEQAPLAAALIVLAVLASAILGCRARSRRDRRYVRMRIVPYRGDDASAAAIVGMFEALHKRLLARWWRRLLEGQPSLSLEVHLGSEAWLAVSCPDGTQPLLLSALRSAYPNCRLEPAPQVVGAPPALLRLKKGSSFIRRVKAIDRFEHEREPFMNRLLRTMAASGGPGFVQLAMTPAPASFERHARRMFRAHENRISRERGEGLIEPRLDRSLVQEVELWGGLDVQHRPLFFVDVRIVAANRRICERIASGLRAEVAENHLVERGATVRQGLLGIYRGRVMRGEGNPFPATRRGVFSSPELAAMWQLPSLDFLSVPLRRSSVPVAPAPAAIMRVAPGLGTLEDARGPVSVHPAMRRQNTAVVGTVEQGKSSYLVASVVEDLRRPRCAIILLDPKGDAADAALAGVPAQRTCTLLDLCHPTCGFNPLAVDAPADVIADYVVEALKNLYSESDIRASSDRYLRNAIIAVLAYDRASTLWDAARLLSVGQEGYAYRARVGARVRELPELKEISDFFTAELSAQLVDARGSTTAKLDAPVNKLARLLNSPSIKRVLLNESLRIDFDLIIRERQVLVVKGALGRMGAGNTSVLMQLLVGMLDAALSRQQDLVRAEDRVAVALKVDEAPLVLNRGFAETMALKRSAGLETVACWQANAQWVDREVRDQLDALFAHRVYFATASVQDARDSAALMMAQFSDVVRPRIDRLSVLGHPDARLHLPKHYAIASWSTPTGRQMPFVGKTLPLSVDSQRLAWHAAEQARRGGTHLTDLSQRHWDDDRQSEARGGASRAQAGAEAATDVGAPSSRDAAGRATVAAPRPRTGSLRLAPANEREPGESSNALPTLPERSASSYSELVALESAPSARMVRRGAIAASPRVDARDLQLLASIATFGHVLSSQLHRRLGGSTSVTGTQRRLKRLADAGLIERMQFHARDGGGAPMCYTIAAAGLELLAQRLPRDWESEISEAELASAPHAGGEPALSKIRRDVHAAGWALALERALGHGPLTVVGPRRAALSPPLRSTREGRLAIGPAELRLPGGRAPHGFQRSAGSGGDAELRSFETVRPALRVEAIPCLDGESSQTSDVLVELDDRRGTAAWEAKLRRYDHFLTGWSTHMPRYGPQRDAPLVVFVCRDRSRARECARRADGLLLASRAYAGEHPAQWQYTGRSQILFAAERDVHEGQLGAYAVASVPPAVRAKAGQPQTMAPSIAAKPIIAVHRGRGSEAARRR
jgi:hypothetical protein